jgi:hypothetical protein
MSMAAFDHRRNAEAAAHVSMAGMKSERNECGGSQKNQRKEVMLLIT